MRTGTTRLAPFCAFLAVAVLGAACAAPAPDAPGVLLGVEAIEDVLPFFDGRAMREPHEGDALPPMRVLLSRSRYWAQDGHLDVVVQLNEDAPQGEVRCRILGQGGAELSRFAISPLPSPRFIFYPAIPQALLQGGSATLETTWARGGQTVAEDSQSFRVEVHPENAPRSGRVRLTVPNQTGAVLRGAPVRLGVPFPRGTLTDAAHLRLEDANGAEVHMQAETTARWSKYGSVKWVLLGFAVNLDGGPRELFLEYGPDVRRAGRVPLAVGSRSGFPAVDAGSLRFDNGLWYDAGGDGDFVKVLEERALRGAFVEHEDGRTYRVPADAEWTVEESGPEKIVLKSEGWYREDGGDGEFCQFIVRWVVHRDSPVARVFHTWIFTGDGNRDRIANMGWEFDLPDGFQRQGFLTSFGEGGEWLDADYLLQWDYEHFDAVSGGQVREFPGGRAAGAAAARGNGARLLFGAKDFWQNYPSELEFSGGSVWFHNWPRHNRPAGYTFEGELVTSAGDPAPASAVRHAQYEPGRLTRSEWKQNIIQARFAHEGEVLDFRLPDRLGENPVWRRMSRARTGSTYWVEGDTESANAQGISRTEEMWLVLSPERSPLEQAAPVLAGLNDETLRGVADPAWVAASGAFYEMHHQDWDKYPEEERLFEQLALAPQRWQERLGLYGMWIFGDLAVWGEVSLDRLEPRLYRAFRKRHHGWPYSWIPFARSGDTRLLRAADAAARQLIDAAHCHYVSEDVRQRVELSPLFHRRRGLLHRSTLPWATRRGATTRCYETQADYLWHSWHLTGYSRAKDVVMDWAEMTKVEESLSGRGAMRISPSIRATAATLKSYMETYEATHDPWFLVAAHALAEGHKHQYDERAYATHGATGQERVAAGHFWQAGDREYLRFTGDEGFHEYYLAYADFWGGHWRTPSWQNYGAPVVESNAYAWLLTGEEHYLRRTANFLDWLKVAVWDGDEPEYVRGYYARGSSHGPPIYTGWALQYFPTALATLEQAGRRPDPIPDIFEIAVRNPVVAAYKEAGQTVDFRLRPSLRRYPDRTVSYEITGPMETRIAGEWHMQQEATATVPAEAPAGAYRLTVQNARNFVLPAVKRTDVPEVVVFAPGEEVHLGQYNNQLWFYVPEGVERFGVEIPLGTGYRTRRVSVWGPDGDRVWNLNYHRATYQGDDPARADIEVAPGQAGRLWRITLPDSAARFAMDPQIPPVYSVCRTRWFDPEQ